MSKIGEKIYEIEYLNEIAGKDQWVNRIHPLVKLFITLMYIVIVVSFDKYNLIGVVSMFVYPLMLFYMADLSWKDAFSRLRIVLPIVCIVGILNPFFDRQIVTYVGNTGISGGVLSMLSLMFKGALTVFASYILIATTTIGKICYALRLIHVPKIVVTEIMLIYRYITVLMHEAKRITQAYSLRAPGQKGVHIKAWGSLVGQLLIRSMDRADNVYESMCLRGFSGEYPLNNSAGGKNSIKLADVLFLIFWTVLFVIFRIFPVFNIIGGLFV